MMKVSDFCLVLRLDYVNLNVMLKYLIDIIDRKV